MDNRESWLLIGVKWPGMSGHVIEDMPSRTYRGGLLMKDRFIGTWTLDAYTRKHRDGRVSYPLGEKAAGRLTYTRSGLVSAQLMNVERPRMASDNPNEAAIEEIQSAFQGYTAYFGWFEIDEEKKEVIHHVEGALYPNMIGTDLKRNYKFEDDHGKLHLTLLTFKGDTLTLTWKRSD
jgi:hypothetical protein